MHKVRKYWPVLLVSLLAGLVVLFPSLGFNYIVKPIAVLVWAAWRMALSVDQSTYWLVLLAVCVLLMARFLSSDKKPASHPAYRYMVNPTNRVEAWQRMLRESASGDRERNSLRASLEKLVLASISTGRRSRSTDLKERIASGEISLPVEIENYLFPPPQKQGWLIGRIKPPLLNGRMLWKGNRVPPDEVSIDEVLRWIENYLEINHDR